MRRCVSDVDLSVASFLIVIQMQRRWPALATYDSCWPVVSIVKLALKYTSEASKRKDTEPATGSARV